MSGDEHGGHSQGQDAGRSSDPRAGRDRAEGDATDRMPVVTPNVPPDTVPGAVLDELLAPMEPMDFDADQTEFSPAPPGAPEDQEPPARLSEPLMFVSMKPPSHPGNKRKTPVIAAIDRPEMKPRLRPLHEGKRLYSIPPADLGRYAPPRPQSSMQLPSLQSPIWLYVVLGIAAALIGAGIALWAVTT